MLELMLMPLRKYAQFHGRARRAEYWWFILFVIIIETLAILADRAIGKGPFTAEALATPAGAMTLSALGPVYVAVSLLLALPSIAVAVRRLHDTNRSGWWYLIGLVPVIGALVLLWWFIKRGTAGGNDYGPDPK